jgi:hypothetical protein
MAHAQKPDFVFRRNGQVHLNRRGRQFIRLLTTEVCASALVMLDTPLSEVVWEHWLPNPFASFPFTSPPARHLYHQVSNALYFKRQVTFLTQTDIKTVVTVSYEIHKGLTLHIFLAKDNVNEVYNQQAAHIKNRKHMCFDYCHYPSSGFIKTNRRIQRFYLSYAEGKICPR